MPEEINKDADQHNVGLNLCQAKSATLFWLGGCVVQRKLFWCEFTSSQIFFFVVGEKGGL